MPPKQEKNTTHSNLNDEQEVPKGNQNTRSSSRARNSQNNSQTNMMAMDEIKTEIDSPSKGSKQVKKRKCGDDLTAEPDMKRTAQEMNSSTPRRSSRSVVPNRKFKDMEVDFTPGRKSGSKKETKQRENTESAVKADIEQKPKRCIATIPKKGRQPSCYYLSQDKSLEMGQSSLAGDKLEEEMYSVSPDINMSIVKLEAEATKLSNAKQEDTGSQPVKDFKSELVEEKDSLPNTQKGSDGMLTISARPIETGGDDDDYSIIREEDLERITSELLELAQNAEQENTNLQQIFKVSEKSDQPEYDSSDYTVTNLKVIEVPIKTGESDVEAINSNDAIKEGDDMSNQPSTSDEGLLVIPGSSNVLSDNKEDEPQNTSSIVIGNLMQKQSRNSNNEGQNSNESDEQLKDVMPSKIVIRDNQKITVTEIGDLAEVESDLQLVIKNALLQLSEKSTEGANNLEGNNSSSNEGTTVLTLDKETTTENHVIKLPSLNPKSRLAPVVKTVTVTDSDGSDGDKAKQPIRQEFIVVQVPDGQIIKRAQVKVNKPEEDIPFNVDENGIYHCGVCDYQTDKKINLYKHRKKHVDDKPHFCPYCSYRAATSSNLKRHISIHNDVRNFQCDICKLSFRQKIHLERHIKYRHEEKKVQCPLCDYVCANENPDLKVHMKRRHLPQDGEDGSVQAYKCEECDLVTVNKKDFQQHMKFHKGGPELKLFCDECSFVTDCESRLKRHSYIHSKEKPFQCGFCDYSGSQKEHVLRHMRSQHNVDIAKKERKAMNVETQLISQAQILEDSNDSQNDELGMKINGALNKLEKHDYSSNAKIFACNYCTMKFSKLLNLYKHLHSQHKDIFPDGPENEFLCVVCDFKTTSKKNLLVHMRKHNQIDQIPPSHVYSCVLCNYINPKRRNLFQHMKKKHGIEIVMKDDGSTSCFMADANSVSSQGDENVQNILTVGDMVTTETDEQELQIVTDGFEKDGLHVQNVISFDDIAYSVSRPQPHNRKMIILDQNALIKQHEAAEAIEGLQALAEQPGILTTQENMSDTEIIAADDSLEVKCENEFVTMGTSDIGNQKEAEDKMASEDGIQLSADDVMQLSAGDFVEINGEMYKVEISETTSSELESAMSC